MPFEIKRGFFPLAPKGLVAALDRPTNLRHASLNWKAYTFLGHRRFLPLIKKAANQFQAKNPNAQSPHRPAGGFGPPLAAPQVCEGKE